MLGWWLVLGCGSPDPWVGAPAPPLDTNPITFVLEVRGEPAGIEQRWTSPGGDRGSRVIRRRTWSVRLGGEDATLRASTEVLTDAEGLSVSYQRWRDGTVDRWEGRAWLPDVAPPPEAGRWPVLDPWTLEIVSSEIAIEADGQERTVSWTTPAGSTTARFDPVGLAEATHGVVRMIRHEGPPPPLTAFDPAALFAIPVSPRPRARRALIGHFTVDGDPIVVQAPLWAEVRGVRMPPAPSQPPADPLAAEAWSVLDGVEDQREAVRRLVRHVADRLDGVPQPGSLKAVEALEAGQGDCDEAAASFVALARAVGLEADPVGGLVYANGVVGPALYPHAWAEVRLGGRRVAVDPALGQAPADASHVRLGASASEAAARLASGVRVSIDDLR